MIMEKKEHSQVCWYHQATPPDIDYSENRAEPGLVMTMREIIDRYMQTGSVPAGIAGNGTYDDVDFDAANESQYDDLLDVMAAARSVQIDAADAAESHSASKRNPTKEKPRSATTNKEEPKAKDVEEQHDAAPKDDAESRE